LYSGAVFPDADADDDVDEDDVQVVETRRVLQITTSDDDANALDIIRALKAADLNMTKELFEAASFSYTSRKNELVLLYNYAQTITDLGGIVTRVSTGDGRSFFFAQDVRRDLARSAHASTLGMDYNNTRSATVSL
jgi:hypothetical protein